MGAPSWLAVVVVVVGIGWRSGIIPTKIVPGGDSQIAAGPRGSIAVLPTAYWGGGLGLSAVAHWRLVLFGPRPACVGGRRWAQPLPPTPCASAPPLKGRGNQWPTTRDQGHQALESATAVSLQACTTSLVLVLKPATASLCSSLLPFSSQLHGPVSGAVRRLTRMLWSDRPAVGGFESAAWKRWLGPVRSAIRRRYTLSGRLARRSST